MSVAVELEALAARVAEYGSRAYLLTVTDDRVPHVVSVEVAVQDGLLVTSVGRSTGANLGARPRATFLWPPPEPSGDYSLIVDGTAVDPSGEGPITIEPTRAVLHRVAGATGTGPTCVPVMPG
ncbi:MAG: hypothetical protein JXA83_10685 [Acidimicrobiales bacterium]|nr:hypothetical protein [Acidimicrobiales bacterium]